MNKGLITLLTLIILASGCSTTGIQKQNQVQGSEATVTDVVDGDTVDIRLGETTETVRLIGIDTPEVHVEVSPEEYENIPENDRGRTCLREWGEKASEFAEQKLAGKKVNFTTDPYSDTRGTYGRLLGYININQTNFNYRLVEKGLARVYDSKFRDKQRFLQAEQKAQERMKGLWQCQEFEIRNLTVE